MLVSVILAISVVFALFLLFLFVFLAAKQDMVSKETLNLLASSAGVVSFIAALVFFVLTIFISPTLRPTLGYSTEPTAVESSPTATPITEPTAVESSPTAAPTTEPTAVAAVESSPTATATAINRAPSVYGGATW